MKQNKLIDNKKYCEHCGHISLQEVWECPICNYDLKEMEVKEPMSMTKKWFMFSIGLLVILAIGIFAMWNVSAIDSIPAVKQGQCVDLPQAEFGSLYQNISGIQLPNKTIVAINENMTKANNLYSYNFCQTDLTGKYVVNGFSDLSTWAYDFEVTPTGLENTTPQMITYLMLLALILLFSGICTYGFFKIPNKNIKTEDGQLMKINWQKYLKWTCAVFVYISVMWVFYIAWNLSFAFSNFSTMTDIFKMLFRIFMIASLPLLVSSVILGFVYWIKDKKLNEMLERGLTVYDK